MAAESFSQIIDKWPTRTALCADIGVTPGAVTNMIARNSVNPRYWMSMVAGAAERGLPGVTLSALTKAAQTRRTTVRKYTTTCTADGTWIALDPDTGVSASGRTLDEALAELRRLLAGRAAA